MRLLVVLCVLFAACAPPRETIPDAIPRVSATLATDAVADDPDDPAVWVNPADAANSLILGTNKAAAPNGALLVFGLDGKLRQRIGGIDRPNNVDVEYGFQLDGQSVDIAVLTERYAHRLLVYRIAPGAGELSLIAAVPVFEGETGEFAEPMGIALYRRASDGAVFAIVGRKNGPVDGYLWQYRLEEDGRGGIRGSKVRQFGSYSGSGEIEAIAVDDAMDAVYYADEALGIRKWAADPQSPEAAEELALFGTKGFEGDREGIAVYATGKSSGYVICTDQLDGNSRYRVFRREGRADNPNDHSELVGVFSGGADATDGIEAISAPLGDRFPRGIFVAMNSSARNFLVYDWRSIEAILAK